MKNLNASKQQNTVDLMNVLKNDFIVLEKPKNDSVNVSNVNSNKSAKQIISQLLDEISSLNLIGSDTSSDLKFMINDFLDNSNNWNDLILEDDLFDFDENE